MGLLQDKKLPVELQTLIGQFNQVNSNQHVAKLMYLQKITSFTRANAADDNVSRWSSQAGAEGIEASLQLYSIHRDAAPLLQNVEFANAVTHFSPASPQAKPTPFFSAQQEKEKLLKEPVSETSLSHYARLNNDLIAHYKQNPEFQEKIVRYQHFLALSYAKLESIKGSINGLDDNSQGQQFSEYQTKVLGHLHGNNKNFTFNIEGESEKLVVRVESREDLGKEAELQVHPVSEYFAEDYASVMIPFEIGGQTSFRPVAISQFANQGDLLQHALSLRDGNNSVTPKVEKIFTQFNDFLLKLVDSGHYHPDIKLTNFLINNDKLILSDRKTIIDTVNPYIGQVSTSPNYAAPEVYRHVKLDENGTPSLSVAAHRLKVDMPAHMSYQSGMALKEFLLASGAVPMERNFSQQLRSWKPLSNYCNKPDDATRNLSVLVQELTRADPKERLSIANFQTLLKQIHQKPQDFLKSVEKVAVSRNSLDAKDTSLLKQALTSSESIAGLKGKIEKIEGIKALCQDPRVNIRELLEKKPLEHLKEYIKKVDKASYKKEAFPELKEKLAIALFVSQQVEYDFSQYLNPQEQKTYKVIQSHFVRQQQVEAAIASQTSQASQGSDLSSIQAQSIKSESSINMEDAAEDEPSVIMGDDAEDEPSVIMGDDAEDEPSVIMGDDTEDEPSVIKSNEDNFDLDIDDFASPEEPQISPSKGESKLMEAIAIQDIISRGNSRSATSTIEATKQHIAAPDVAEQRSMMNKFKATAGEFRAEATTAQAKAEALEEKQVETSFTRSI